MKQSVSEQTKFHPEIVSITIKAFWNSVRANLKSKKDINIKGFFTITMKQYYRKKVTDNPSINLWKRKDQKTYEK